MIGPSSKNSPLLIKACLLVLLSTSPLVYAQESAGEEVVASFHHLTLELGHAHVPGGIKENGNKQWLVLGSWGLNYDYWFLPKWAVGLHSDIIVENFEVEKTGGEDTEGILERSYPLASALMGVYKPGEHFSVMLGAGGEFAKEETLILIRAGIEYGWELPGEWEIGLILINDFKVDAYNSWNLGVGISKIFGKKAEGREE